MPSVDLSAPRLDVDYTRGDQRIVEVTVVDDDTDVVVDVSGDTFAGKIRKHADDELAAEITIDTTDAATGVIRYYVMAEDAADLAGSYEYDIKQTTDGAPVTIIAGKWKFDPNVTYDDV